MLWFRGCIFTVLVPYVVGVVLPRGLRNGTPPAGGWWQTGWALAAAGGLLYGWCLLLFLLSGGTPAVFFTRRLAFLIGREPGTVVRTGPYRVSRNPMYVAVVSAVLGQACIYRSVSILLYGLACALVFHAVVVWLEEPHLRRIRGPEYERYLRTVPRWLMPGRRTAS